MEDVETVENFLPVPLELVVPFRLAIVPGDEVAPFR